MRSRLKALQELLDQMYADGRACGLRGRPMMMGTFNRHADRAYQAGWHDGRTIRNEIIARLGRDASVADLDAAADVLIDEVAS